MVSSARLSPSRGEVWWANLGIPEGSEPGFRRPVVVVQSDALNLSRIDTIICIPLSSNPELAYAPGNIQLTRSQTGLSKDSVANVSQIVAINRQRLTERVGKLATRTLDSIYMGLDIVLGR